MSARARRSLSLTLVIAAMTTFLAALAGYSDDTCVSITSYGDGVRARPDSQAVL
jgi:hypothetical protein